VGLFPRMEGDGRFSSIWPNSRIIIENTLAGEACEKNADLISMIYDLAFFPSQDLNSVLGLLILTMWQLLQNSFVQGIVLKPKSVTEPCGILISLRLYESVSHLLTYLI